jgi:hypothetical protein
VAINSYFYDSVAGDRPYSAADFAKAFGMVFKTGVIADDETGNLGFDLGGANLDTVYAGRATIQGRFIEVTGTEVLTVPSGSYSGQVVIRVDKEDARIASLVVKADREPIQDEVFYELPLYDVTVSNGVISVATDIRVQGGATLHAHNHAIADIANLTSSLNAKQDSSNAITWQADINGIRAIMGKFAGTGKPVVLYLTSAQPSASSTEHRVWIQIDKF